MAYKRKTTDRPYSIYLKSLNKRHCDLTKEELSIYNKLMREHSPAWQKRKSNPEVKEKEIAYREYYKKNRLQDVSKKWRENPENKLKVQQYNKEYYKRPDVKQRRKEWIRNRREEDKNFDNRLKLREWLGSQYKRLNRNRSAGEDKWQQIVGCSMEDFKKHIESLFEEGMDWSNWGAGENMWNIDHIKPLNTFDLTDPDQLQQCSHFSNLRPLWYIDNVKRPHSGSDILSESGS